MALWRSDERLGPLPDWLSEILEVVLSDFQQPAVIDLLVGYDAARQMVGSLNPEKRAALGSASRRLARDRLTRRRSSRWPIGFRTSSSPRPEPRGASLARGVQATLTRWLPPRLTGRRGRPAPSTTGPWCASAHSGADPLATRTRLIEAPTAASSRLRRQALPFRPRDGSRLDQAVLQRRRHGTQPRTAAQASSRPRAEVRVGRDRALSCLGLRKEALWAISASLLCLASPKRSGKSVRRPLGIVG